ncbi:uncharacterized protein LY79DRAFT_222670 [Colletotrichum navitas]|uniref:Secreted protein n=1 Tax=Colletotrichum navitas TaxID=681940 RepID=A0AAD8PHX7_9PEZI|nr:uncharacterized protein LY79DRAFT_222670 [Colletotrichum navitas]KAK1561396.1 hypothetical protein LY79DRAFT_222670 [Colletotrichum navitas]
MLIGAARFALASLMLEPSCCATRFDARLRTSCPALLYPRVAHWQLRITSCFKIAKMFSVKSWGASTASFLLISSNACKSSVTVRYPSVVLSGERR